MKNIKNYNNDQIKEALDLIKKYKLYNLPTEEKTTILPLVNNGYNKEGDVPYHAFIAFDGDNAVGMALLTEREYQDEHGSFECEYSVGHLYVSKTHRGRGLGSELINKCKEYFQKFESNAELPLYWYYTNDSRRLYEKEQLNDVVLFESMHGISHSDEDKHDYDDIYDDVNLPAYDNNLPAIEIKASRNNKKQKTRHNF
jgi:GNAT superfamily N-acetyltransferase